MRSSWPTLMFLLFINSLYFVLTIPSEGGLFSLSCGPVASFSFLGLLSSAVKIGAMPLLSSIKEGLQLKQRCKNARASITSEKRRKESKYLEAALKLVGGSVRVCLWRVIIQLFHEFICSALCVKNETISFEWDLMSDILYP